MRNHLTVSLVASLTALSPLALLTESTAHAQASVYLWGFQRGGQRIADIDRLVEKRLFTEGRPVVLLKTPEAQPLPACTSEVGPQAFRHYCSATRGQVLGGQVVVGKSTTRTRLWLYDLGNGQTAYADNYCQNCDLISALSAHAKHLLEQPRFGIAPTAKPSYCEPHETQQAPLAASGPVFLTVYGEGKHRAPLYAALKTQLEGTGRRVLPVPVESKTYALDVLQKIVAGQQNARVLGVELQKDGKVALFLFDQKTELTDDKTVNCPECERDTLIAQTKQAAVEILERCFGAQCGSGTTSAPVPPEACEAFPEPDCPAMSSSGLSALPTSGSYIDPGTAKAVKGALWGTFAASAAAGIFLLSANKTSLGTHIDGNGIPIDNNLWYPGWAAMGISFGLLAVAIPTTIIVNHAAKNSSAATSSTPATAAHPVQCPG